MTQEVGIRSTGASKHRYLTLVALIVPNIVIWMGLFMADGIIIQRDFNFPIFNDNFESAYFPLWNEFTSQTNIERFPRLVMMAPFLGLSMLGVEISLILKIMIMGTFTVLTTGAYLFSQYLLRNVIVPAADTSKVQLIALTAAYLFAYNPVNLQFIGGISILLSVGMLPILLYIVLTRMNTKYFPILMPLPLLFSLGHPFVFVTNIAITLIFGFSVHYRVIDLKYVFKKFAISGMMLILLLAWLWVPYSLLQSSSVDLGREENIERETFERVSHNEFYKILFLERDQFIYTITEPAGEVDRLIHYASLSALVITGFFAFLVRQNGILKRVSQFLWGGFLVATILALGNNGYLGAAYWEFVSGSTVGWIFRSPLKFQLYQGFFGAAMVAVSVTLLLQRARIRRVTQGTLRTLAATAVGIIVIGSSGYGIYDANLHSFNPIQLPDEYFEINKILVDNGGGGKVVYFPRYNEIVTPWSAGHLVPPFDMKSSHIATYETSTSYAYVRNAIYDYPYTNSELRSPNFYEYLSALGVKYVVFHNDRGYDLDQRNLEFLQQSESLNNIYSKNGWYLFEINREIPAPIRAVSAVTLVESLPEIYRLSTPAIPAIDINSFDESILENASLEHLYLTDMSAEIPLQNMLANPKFESWTETDLDSWAEPLEHFKISQVSDPGFSDPLLQVTTQFAPQNRWSGIISEEIAVQPSNKYLFTAVAKTQNAYSSHIKIQGYYTAESSWKDMVFVSSGNETSTGLSMNANSDWKRYWNAIVTPDSVSKVRYVINAGGVAEIPKGDAYTLLQGVGVYDLDTYGESNAQVAYQKISATKYDVRIKSDKPMMLVFTEAFDKGWIASDGVQELESHQIYGMLNGFYVDRTGDFSLTLDYRPQKLFALGATISIAAVIGILLYTLKLSYEYFIKSERARSSPVLHASSLGYSRELISIAEGYTTHREKTRHARSLLASILFYSPVILAIGLVGAIPVMLFLEEIEQANFIAFFALDFLIIGCIWTAIGHAVIGKNKKNT
jgi:hypothetical protein